MTQKYTIGTKSVGVVEHHINSRKFDHIIFEPGDCTRYSILVCRNVDEFLLTTLDSTFPIPNQMNLYHLKGILRLAEKDEDQAVCDIARLYPNQRYATVLAIAKMLVEVYDL